MLTILMLAVITPTEYVSENKATTVRPSIFQVAEGSQRLHVEGVQRMDTRDALKATNVSALRKCEGRNAVITGKIMSVYVPASRSVVIINFGRNHRTCFKAVVFSRAFELFGGLEALKRLEGKSVAIEGLVADYKGLPQIVLNGSSQLETR